MAQHVIDRFAEIRNVGGVIRPSGEKKSRRYFLKNLLNSCAVTDGAALSNNNRIPRRTDGCASCRKFFD